MALESGFSKTEQDVLKIDVRNVKHVYWLQFGHILHKVPVLKVDGKSIPLIGDEQNGYDTAVNALQLQKGKHGNGKAGLIPREYDGRGRVKEADPFLVAKSATIKTGEHTFHGDIICRDKAIIGYNLEDGSDAMLVIPHAKIEYSGKKNEVMVMKVSEANEEYWKPAELTEVPPGRGMGVTWKLIPSTKTLDEIFSSKKEPFPVLRLIHGLASEVTVPDVATEITPPAPSVATGTSNKFRPSVRQIASAFGVLALTITIGAGIKNSYDKDDGDDSSTGPIATAARSSVPKQVATAAPTSITSAVPTASARSTVNTPKVSTAQSLDSIPVVPQHLQLSGSETSRLINSDLSAIENGTYRAKAGISLGSQIRRPFAPLAYKDPYLTANLDGLHHKIGVGEYVFYGLMFPDAETVRNVLSDPNHKDYKLLRRLIHPKNMGPWDKWDRKLIDEGKAQKDLVGAKMDPRTREAWTAYDAKEYFEKTYLQGFRDFGWIDKNSVDVYSVEAGKELKTYRVIGYDKNGIEIREYCPYIVALAKATKLDLPNAKKTAMNDLWPNNELRPGDRFVGPPDSIPTTTTAPDSLQQMLRGLGMDKPTILPKGLGLPGGGTDKNESAPLPKGLKLIPENGDVPEYEVDTSKLGEEPVSAFTGENNKVETTAINPDVRIAELSKAGLGKRWEALNQNGEIFVPGNGQISFLEIVRRSYLMRCDTLKQKTAVAEAIKGIKLKELAEYYADDTGNLYVKLAPAQLERLNAAIDMPSEHVGVQEISRARSVLDIRSRVSAAANRTTKPASTKKELDIDADILMAELNLMAA